MKYIIILGDGMSDYPIESLGNKTPLMAANTPNIDGLCAISRTGKFKTVPDSMPPGSEIANMAVIGYDVEKVYEGRGVLEAASMGVDLDENDLALRCNIVCIENEILKNHSAGHISNEEALEIVKTLQLELETDDIKIHPGVSYRHLLVIKNGKKDV
jgi:2,3-bisphosphoglycerate-independent phosphoglycerate mutase